MDEIKEKKIKGEEHGELIEKMYLVDLIEPKKISAKLKFQKVCEVSETTVLKILKKRGVVIRGRKASIAVRKKKGIYYYPKYCKY